MKLYLLRPIGNLGCDPWNPWYDKSFGFVVRAKDETSAREIASKEAGFEDGEIESIGNPWLSTEYSSCVVLTTKGDAGIIIKDFHSA